MPKENQLSQRDTEDNMPFPISLNISYNQFLVEIHAES